jgi:hypothetical protein
MPLLNRPARIASTDHIFWEIANDDGSGANDAAVPNTDPGSDEGLSADPDARANYDW